MSAGRRIEAEMNTRCKHIKCWERAVGRKKRAVVLISVSQGCGKVGVYIYLAAKLISCGRSRWKLNIGQ